MPILESEMPLDAMKKRARTHKCGVCGGNLTVCWGGSYGYDQHILKCAENFDHDTLTDLKQQSKEYEEGNKLFRRLHGMDTTALMKMEKAQMLARIGQAKFPTDLTPKESALMAEVSISYGLDPLMQELMIYQGNPYPTINARYRKAQETGKFDGIDTRPATEEERKVRNAKEGDYLYRAEVWVKGASHPFVGWGRVRAAETTGNPHLPIVKDPDRQAEKRSEAMGLRKAFSMPVPFQSWEEFEEQRADSAIEGEYKILDKETGEITEPEPEAETPPDPEPEPEPLPDDVPEGEPEQPEEPVQPELKPDEKRDERTAPTKLITEVKQLFYKDLEKSQGDLGKLINEEKKWGIKDLKNMKTWQAKELIAIAKKEMGKDVE